jgi:hypothetical protein
MYTEIDPAETYKGGKQDCDTYYVEFVFKGVYKSCQECSQCKINNCGKHGVAAWETSGIKMGKVRNYFGSWAVKQQLEQKGKYQASN